MATPSVPTEEIVDLSPFKRLVMTIGTLPTAFTESMTYYEALAYFVKYLEEVTTAVNQNAEATKELQTLFTELKNYVDTYFDNLDVQEEINNKLDEMAESGQLADIISLYLNSIAVFAYDTISDMISAENLTDGSYARTTGYNSVNDGGGSLYKIRTKDVSDVPDGGLLIAMSDNTLVAQLIVENGTVNPSQFGAVGDGVNDDTTAIQKAIDSGYTVEFVKNYGFSHLTFDFASYNIDGKNHTLYYVGDGSQTEAILFEGVYSVLHNFRITNSTAYELPAIRWRSKDTSHYSQFNHLSQIRVNFFELAIFYGIATDQSISVPQSENYVDNFRTRGVHRVLYSNQPNGHIYFTNSTLMCGHGEELYTYVANTACIAENVAGEVHIDNSILLNPGDANGTGLKGYRFDVTNCSYEIAGTTLNLNGETYINGLSGGYKGNPQVEWAIINKDTNNTAYPVRIENVDISNPSNSANVSIIKNNDGSNANVILDNCKFKGSVFGSTRALSQCFGNEVNTFYNNELFNFNLTEITKNNYLRYFNVTNGSVSVDGDYIVCTGSNGFTVKIAGYYDGIFEFVSDMEVVEGTMGVNCTTTSTSGSQLTLSRTIEANTLTNIYSKRPEHYKYQFSLYAPSGQATLKFKKIAIRGRDLSVTTQIAE